MGRANYKDQQEIIVQAVSKVEEGEVQEKHASSHKPQEKQHESAMCLDQTKQTKSEDEPASNNIQSNKSVIAVATEEPNVNNKDSDTEKVLQVADQGESFTVLSRDHEDENVMDTKGAATVTTQNKPGDSVPVRDGSCSTDLLKKTTHDETDLIIDQATATSSDPESFENEKPSSSNIEKSEEEKESKDSAMITCNAAETTAQRSSSLNTELQVSENQLDAVGETSDQQPGPCVNTNQAENNEMGMDQGQVSETNFATVLQTADNPDQMDTNFNQDEEELKQKLTDESIVEMKSENSSDENEGRLNPDTTLTQFDQASSGALMTESLQGAEEKNSESSLRYTSVQQEIETSEKNESSILEIPCGEESQPQLKDSGSLSITGEVKNNETEAIDSMPSRDVDAENKLITALRLSCKLSPGHLVKDLDVKGVVSVHLMRSLSPGVVTVAELVQKLVYLTELDLSGNLLGPQGFRVICLALRGNTAIKCLNLANNVADTDSSVSTECSVNFPVGSYRGILADVIVYILPH